MKIFSILFFTILLTTSGGAALACTCGGYPSVCEAYGSADAVFIGSVQRVQNKMKKEDGEVYLEYQTADVQIETSFKGIKDVGVVFRSHGSSCDAIYKEGQRWLFFAYYDKKEKVWEIRGCDRSTLIESAAEALLYLQGLPAAAQKTRISGTLQHYEDSPSKKVERFAPLIGVKMKITGEQKTYEVYTDKNGVYEIYGLAPGVYKIEPEIPAGLDIFFPVVFGENVKADKDGWRILLKEKSCAGANFVFNSDTSISGKLIGADGRALPHVCLRLTPKNKVVASNWKFGCTDKEGRYKLERVPPGEYLIVVNDDNKISSRVPFPKAYYPGVFEKEKAVPLTVIAGVNLENYDIHIPSQEATRVIEGTLLYSDGRPVADQFVQFKAETVKEGYADEASTKTDAQGRFSLPVLQGLKGSLSGFMFTYAGQYVNCPQLEKLIKARNGDEPEVETPPVKLEINRDIQDVKLVFPFPACEKARRN